MGGHLVNAVLGQAQYQDLSALMKTNRKIAKFDATAETLAETMAGAAPTLAASLQATARLLADVAFASLSAGEETLEKAVSRLNEAYAAEPWHQNGLADPGDRDAWARLLAAFERTASLQEKDTMTLLTICAEKSEFLGDALAAFGGFTAEAVRHYDYEIGRDKTQQWLRDPARNKLGLDLTGYMFEPVNLVADRVAAVVALNEIAGPAGDDLGSRAAHHSKLIMDRFGIGWPIKNMLASGINGFAAHYVTGALKDEADTPPPKPPSP
jgi:hypothetical protein